jgi:hypothetical protein
MLTQQLLSQAVQYYACYIYHLIPGEGAVTIDELVDLSSYEDPFGSSVPRLRHPQLILDGLQLLADKKILEFVRDDFGPDIIMFHDSGPLESLKADKNSPFFKYQLARNAGGSWIQKAIDALNTKIDRDSKSDPKTESGIIETRGAEASTIATRSRSAEDEPWEPLKIDRADVEYQTAVEVSEKAIETIEQNNGYAASEPEERNGIIKVMRGTLDAIKEGTPSRAAVKAGLLQPLRYIAKKFSDSAMGEVAKVAIGALIKYFF